MICPYCGNEMIPGYIHGGAKSIVDSALRWLPENVAPTVTSLTLDADNLSNNSIFSEPKIKTYKCNLCIKYIIDPTKD